MTYFKVPTNKFIKLSEKKFKLQFDFKDISFNICSHSLNKYLNQAKKSIDEVSHLWDNIKIYTNPYEYIHTKVPNYSFSVSKYRPISEHF